MSNTESPQPMTKRRFKSVWNDTGKVTDHFHFRATPSGQRTCAQCIERKIPDANCEGSSNMGCVPCVKENIAGCSRLTTFRIWNAMRTFNMTTNEVGGFIERYIAKESVTDDDDEPDEYPEMKKMLEEKEKEIVRLTQLLKGHTALDDLRTRLDETKGHLGYDRMLKAERSSREQAVDIRILREKLREYHVVRAVTESEAVSRISAYEKAIVKLDEFIAFPYPNRDPQEHAELNKIRGRFAAIWELDREDTITSLGSGWHRILSPEHKLGEGLSEIL